MEHSDSIESGASLLQWAEAEAERLDEIAENARRYEQQDRSMEGPDRRVETAAAIEFLRRFASGSAFTSAAERALDDRYHDSSAVADVAGQLRNWVRFVRDGLAGVQPFSVRARIEAATDLMEQIQALLEDRGIHPAAPVVLAGAALEEFLRAMWEMTDEPLQGQPSISKYAEALRRLEMLSRQDIKDISGWAGLRNNAAHGHFDDLSADRARLMVDGINLFMRQHGGT